jgi:hypothetical protein
MTKKGFAETPTNEVVCGSQVKIFSFFFYKNGSSVTIDK